MVPCRVSRCLAAVVVSLLIFVSSLGTAWAWRSQEYGVKFVPPARWQQRDNGQAGAVVRFMAPEEPGPRASISFSVGPWKDNQAFSAEHAEHLSEKLVGELGGAKILGCKEVKVAGLPAHRLGYRAVHGGIVFRSTQVMFVTKGRLCMFSLVSSARQHDAYIRDFEQLIESIQLHSVK